MGISLREHKGSENKRFGKLGKNVAAMRKQAHILPTDIVLCSFSENTTAKSELVSVFWGVFFRKGRFFFQSIIRTSGFSVYNLPKSEWSWWQKNIR